MGLCSLFTRHRSTDRTTVSASVAAKNPEPQEPPTPEQLADLQDAWAELAEAARGSGVKGFHACGRGGKPWQEDPAAVRSMATLFRRFQEENTTADVEPA